MTRFHLSKARGERREAASAARLCIHLRPFLFHFWELMSKNQRGAQHKQTEDVLNKCHEPSSEDCEDPGLIPGTQTNTVVY